jgi:hypothetical protein
MNKQTVRSQSPPERVVGNLERDLAWGVIQGMQGCPNQRQTIAQLGCHNGSLLVEFCEQFNNSRFGARWQDYFQLVGLDLDLSYSAATRAAYPGMIEFRREDIRKIESLATQSVFVVLIAQLDLELDAESLNRTLNEAARIVQPFGLIEYYGFHPAHSATVARLANHRIQPNETWRYEHDGLISYYRGKDVVPNHFRQTGLRLLSEIEYYSSSGPTFRRLDAIKLPN